jgi:hypothetical protein
MPNPIVDATNIAGPIAPVKPNACVIAPVNAVAMENAVAIVIPVIRDMKYSYNGLMKK